MVNEPNPHQRRSEEWSRKYRGDLSPRRPRRAILLFFAPWLPFYNAGRIDSACICLFIQWTLIGWIPAVWCGFKMQRWLERREDHINANADGSGYTSSDTFLISDDDGDGGDG